MAACLRAKAGSTFPEAVRPPSFPLPRRERVRVRGKDREQARATTAFYELL
jgi:hypothetical protein